MNFSIKEISFSELQRILPVTTGAQDLQRLLIAPGVHLTSKRKLTTPTAVLFDDKKLEDFRAREEQKEAEFNKQPAAVEEKFEQEQPEDDEAVTEIRNKILEASLAFVDSAGWTRQAIVKGAEQAGFPGTVHGMFPKGGIELINYFYLKSNQELVEQMREKVGENSEKVGDPKEFVCWAIRQRLAMLHPHIKTWPQALAMMTLPPNVPTSLANMLTLVDDICYYSGDRSVDVSESKDFFCHKKLIEEITFLQFNWYARRIGLATIYKATELYILQDSSPENDSTWKFLERRISDAGVVHDVLVQSEDATKHLQSAVSSVFSTARNILGLNFDRR